MTSFVRSVEVIDVRNLPAHLEIESVVALPCFLWRLEPAPASQSTSIRGRTSFAPLMKRAVNLFGLELLLTMEALVDNSWDTREGVIDWVVILWDTLWVFMARDPSDYRLLVLIGSIGALLLWLVLSKIHSLCGTFKGGSKGLWGDRWGVFNHYW